MIESCDSQPVNNGEEWQKTAISLANFGDGRLETRDHKPFECLIGALADFCLKRYGRLIIQVRPTVNLSQEDAF